MSEKIERRERKFSRSELLRWPAVESFSNPEHLTEIWNKDIATNKDFLSEVKSRHELNERLEAVLEKLPRPDISLQSAVERGLVSETQVAELYQSLTPLLEDDSEYRRLALYLPFGFLPKSDWVPDSPDLQGEGDRFRQAYMSAWQGLLTTHDVRANFVDGDVLEVDARTGDLPRVVKAAHLIPKLVEAGLLDTQEVLTLLEGTSDPVLKQSLADVLPVLVDLGFLAPEDLDRLQAIVPSSALTEKASDASVSKKRAAWLQQEQQRRSLDSAAQKLAERLASEDADDETLKQFTGPKAEAASQRVMVEGLRLAVEMKAKTDGGEAKQLYDRYRGKLLSLRDEGDSSLEESLNKLFYRLHGLKVVDQAELDGLDLTLPALGGPFSENLKSMEGELEHIREIAEVLEKDPELAKYLYPAILVFGSRLKGYGSKTADIDVGVFVKPGTDVSDKQAIRELIGRVFGHEKIGGQAVEFWLEKTATGLAVTDFTDYDPAIGEKSWTHVLLGAAWEGDDKTLADLRNQLLPGYFDDTDERIHGRKARGLYLEELERDALQYRLLHKGYEKFFPAYPGLDTPHVDAVDGQSLFWDEGYRQTATKLFTSRVFIPKVPRPSKVK